MEIRIDTTKDSKEEIRRAIKFLQELVGGEESRELPAGDNVMGNIFDLPTATEQAPAGPEEPEEKQVQKGKEKQSFDGLELY